MSDTNGHGKPCELCGELINCVHGNPAKWGTWLPSGKEPNVSYYHAFCLKEKIDKLEYQEYRHEVIEACCALSGEEFRKRWESCSWEDDFNAKTDPKEVAQNQMDALT